MSSRLKKLAIGLLASGLIVSGPAFGADFDTVYLKNGGRIRGTIMIEDPTSVSVQLPDGSSTKVARADVARVEYAAGGAAASPASGSALPPPPLPPPAGTLARPTPPPTTSSTVAEAPAPPPPNPSPSRRQRAHDADEEEAEQSDQPHEKTGWAGLGALIGGGLGVVGLGLGIGSEVLRAGGDDGTPLGAPSVGFIVVGAAVVSIARFSTNGHGSTFLRIGGTAAFGAYLIGHVAFYGRFLSDSKSYPQGVSGGLSVLGAGSIAMLAIDALIARSSRDDASRQPSQHAWVPLIAADPRGGGTVGVGGTF